MVYTWAAVAALGAGCASTPSATVVMDPMTFEAVGSGDGRVVEHMDPKALFREGTRAFEAQDFDVAARKYRLVHERFPDSRFATVSAFNAGLSLEKAGRHVEAVPFFVAVVDATRGSKDAQDALFRIAACQQAAQDWEGSLATADRILAPHFDGIGVVDRIAATAQRGFARQRLGQLALAERDYKAALRLFKANLEDRALSKSSSVSLAQFQIAEIYRELFASIDFKLPLERMERDLEDKSNFFLMAQNAYLKALRLHHPEFAVIAGYRLGALYEVMYDDMMAAEIPGELSREEVELYYQELRDQIRPFLVRAIDIYERNLRMGQRFGKRDDWVRRTEASLARLKEVLRQESSRDAEAQLRGEIE